MSEHLGFIQAIVVTAIGTAVTAAGAAATWYFRTRGECITSMKRKIDTIDKRSWRIGKAVIISMRMIDKHAADNHPRDKLELESLAKEIINDKPEDFE